jgi:hypothetical protein
VAHGDLEWVAAGEGKKQKKDNKAPIIPNETKPILKHAEKKALSENVDQAENAVHDIMRAALLRAHTGQGALDRKTLLAIVKARTGDSTLAKCVPRPARLATARCKGLWIKALPLPYPNTPAHPPLPLSALISHANKGLAALIGYEMVPELEIDPSYDVRTFVRSRTRFVVRLSSAAAPKTGAKDKPAAPYEGLHAAAVLAAGASPALAAQRGLLIAVLGALACTEDQELDEGALFDALRVDSRLSDAAAGKDDHDNFSDQGAGAHVLARWQDVVRTDFVDARLLTCKKVERAEGAEGGGGGGGGGGGATRSVNRYGVGPAARACVGMVGVLEVVRRVRGDGAEAAGAHSQEKTKAAMAQEVGESFIKTLLRDKYGAADFGGAEEEEEGGEEDEEEEEEEEER